MIPVIMVRPFPLSRDHDLEVMITADVGRPRHDHGDHDGAVS